MGYKITGANEAVTYEAPGHYDEHTTRLHNPLDINDGRLVMGLSRFLPGGVALQNAAPIEFIMS